MKLKIISNGSSNGTKVVDADTGEPVEMLRSVDIHIGIDGISAILEVINPDLDMYNITTNRE